MLQICLKLITKEFWIVLAGLPEHQQSASSTPFNKSRGLLVDGVGNNNFTLVCARMNLQMTGI